jgi:hypothetical protein
VWTTDACDARHRLREPETTVDGIFIRRFRNLHNGLAYHRQLYLPLGMCKAPWHDLLEFDIVHIHSHRHLLEALVGAAAAAHDASRTSSPATARCPRSRRYVLVKARARPARRRPVFSRAPPRCIAVSEVEVAAVRAVGVAGGRIRVIPTASASMSSPCCRRAAAFAVPMVSATPADRLRRQDHAAQRRRRAAARPGAVAGRGPARRRRQLHDA